MALIRCGCVYCVGGFETFVGFELLGGRDGLVLLRYLSYVMGGRFMALARRTFVLQSWVSHAGSEEHPPYPDHDYWALVLLCWL